MTDDIVTRLPKNVLRLDCGCLLYVNSAKHHGVTLHCKDHRTKPEIENDEEGLQETVWWQADEIERLREWKELAYQMRNKYWWAMLGKTLSQFDDMHKADWALPHNVELRRQLKRDAR